MIQPFQVHIPPAALNDLKRRIIDTRWPDETAGTDWHYGMPVEELRALAGYWADGFDWRLTENRINAWPHFIAVIDGHRIHYLHIRGKGNTPVPLIITHGWPGSFLEMMNIIPLLTQSGNPSFDLVIPSLPGYGFSDKPGREGIDAPQIATLWVKLMRELGYEKFLVQGGDLGAEVSSHIALGRPDHVIGLHLNYIPFSYKPWLEPGEKLTEEETAALQKTTAFFQKEGAYAQLHVTRPRMLSYGLNDSPAGLAAWILQIFKSFSDPARTLEQLFDRDELLANITLYWVTETLFSSIRLYGESRKKPLVFKKGDFIKVPVGVAHYPFPPSFPARTYIERGYNLQYWSEPPVGGHFAALEQPQIFSDDIRAFAGTVL